jgi:hypothetical protein
MKSGSDVKYSTSLISFEINMHSFDNHSCPKGNKGHVEVQMAFIKSGSFYSA